MSRSILGGHRTRGRSHPSCPARTYYPDHDTAARAARRLGSNVGPRCRRCSGYHLTLKDTD